MTRMQTQVRTASPADYDRIRELFAEGDEMNLAAMPNMFRRAESTRRRRDEFFDLILADAKFELLVAEAEGQVVGFVQAHMEEARRGVPNLLPRQTLFVDILLVTAEQRGNGVGRELMERTYDWGRGQGATDVELIVFEFNADALAFYDRLGYTTSSRHMWRQLPGGPA